MDAVCETELLNIFVAMIKLLLWQQTLTCLILQTDIAYILGFVISFPFTCNIYLPTMKSISVVTPKLSKFLSFSDRNLN